MGDSRRGSPSPLPEGSRGGGQRDPWIPGEKPASPVARPGVNAAVGPSFFRLRHHLHHHPHVQRQSGP